MGHEANLSDYKTNVQGIPCPWCRKQNSSTETKDKLAARRRQRSGRSLALRGVFQLLDGRLDGGSGLVLLLLRLELVEERVEGEVRGEVAYARKDEPRDGVDDLPPLALRDRKSVV